MTLNELEEGLRRARHDVFSDDPTVSEAAEWAIRTLRIAIENHPDEIARRAKVKQEADARFMFRWR